MMCDAFVDALYVRDQNEFAEIADFIWRNPELSEMEWKAHDFLVGILRRKGFSVQSSYLGYKTAFRAEFEAIPGKEIIRFFYSMSLIGNEYDYRFVL